MQTRVQCLAKSGFGKKLLSGGDGVGVAIELGQRVNAQLLPGEGVVVGKEAQGFLSAISLQEMAREGFGWNPIFKRLKQASAAIPKSFFSCAK